jgi:hypothetical protein
VDRNLPHGFFSTPAPRIGQNIPYFGCFSRCFKYIINFELERRTP